MLFSWTKLWQEKKTRGGNILPTLNLLETLKDLIPSFMLLGDKWVSRCECNSHLDGKNWPKMQINNSSCAQKQPSNQEQEHFPIFSTYRILASLSANISQSYVWKCSLIGQFLKHKLEINTQSSHSITHVYWDFSRDVTHTLLRSCPSYWMWYNQLLHGKCVFSERLEGVPGGCWPLLEEGTAPKTSPDLNGYV